MISGKTPSGDNPEKITPAFDIYACMQHFCCRYNISRNKVVFYNTKPWSKNVALKVNLLVKASKCCVSIATPAHLVSCWRVPYHRGRNKQKRNGLIVYRQRSRCKRCYTVKLHYVIEIREAFHAVVELIL